MWEGGIDILKTSNEAFNNSYDCKSKQAASVHIYIVTVLCVQLCSSEIYETDTLRSNELLSLDKTLQTRGYQHLKVT